MTNVRIKKLQLETGFTNRRLAAQFEVTEVSVSRAVNNHQDLKSLRKRIFDFLMEQPKIEAEDPVAA